MTGKQVLAFVGPFPAWPRRSPEAPFEAAGGGTRRGATSTFTGVFGLPW
jgi:hypothetical protein